MPTLDDNGKAVSRFGSDLRNASKLGVYADTLVAMFQSNAWREYRTGMGHEAWRAHEFDYFLISCDARYQDVHRILTWDTVRAAHIAEAMMGDPSPHRRGLVDASKAWSGPSFGLPTLIETAERNGWLSGRFNDPTLKAPPVPARTRTRVRHGITRDELAKRGRRKRIPAERRNQLNALVARMVAQVPDPTERRYVVDCLMRGLRGERSPLESTTRT